MTGLPGVGGGSGVKADPVDLQHRGTQPVVAGEVVQLGRERTGGHRLHVQAITGPGTPGDPEPLDAVEETHQAGGRPLEGVVVPLRHIDRTALAVDGVAGGTVRIAQQRTQAGRFRVRVLDPAVPTVRGGNAGRRHDGVPNPVRRTRIAGVAGPGTDLPAAVPTLGTMPNPAGVTVLLTGQRQHTTRDGKVLRAAPTVPTGPSLATRRAALLPHGNLPPLRVDRPGHVELIRARQRGTPADRKSVV